VPPAQRSPPAARPPLVVVVEDEPDLRDLIAHVLESAGMRCVGAGTVREALAVVRQHAPDLVVLDLMLPDGSGIDVCRRLREDPTTRDVAIVMLTARTAEIDRVAGLEVGADDYVAKPFSTRELVLRIRAVLRRGRTADDSTVRVGRIAVDRARHAVSVDGAEVKLTALEFNLLATLAERAGQVQARSALLADVWGMHPDLHTRTVDTHVKRLRDRLGDAGDAIETVRGVGYCLALAAK